MPASFRDRLRNETIRIRSERRFNWGGLCTSAEWTPPGYRVSFSVGNRLKTGRCEALHQRRHGPSKSRRTWKTSAVPFALIKTVIPWNYDVFSLGYHTVTTPSCNTSNSHHRLQLQLRYQYSDNTNRTKTPLDYSGKCRGSTRYYTW